MNAALFRDAATQQGGGGSFSGAGGFVGQGFLQFGKLGFMIIALKESACSDSVSANWILA